MQLCYMHNYICSYMQFELRIPIVPFILLCDVRNMLNYTFYYKHYTMVSLTRIGTEERQVVLVCHFFRYQADIFQIGSP